MINHVSDIPKDIIAIKIELKIVDRKGLKSNYFGQDLTILLKSCFQE